MIRLFSATDTTFTSNGDVVLKPLKAKVHKADNSDYYLTLETGLEYIDHIVEGNIVVANTPTGDQAFRISNVTKNKSKISAKCYHVFYDSKNYVIASADIVNLNCVDALTQLNSATEPQTEFSVLSDITDEESFTITQDSFYNAIMTTVSVYGGHLVRDNFSIGIKESIGTDNGIIVQYRKNLKDITCSENWNNVCTKILPVGKDGILLNALDPSANIFIESSTQYDISYTKVVNFSQDIDSDDYPTETAYLTALVADLQAQAQAYLDANALPQVNYTLKANLDRLTDIGDTVEVIDERLGIDLMTNVISFDWDCISETYTEVVFGNFAETINGLVSKINSNTEKVAEQTTQEAIDKTFPDFIEAYGTTDGWSWKKYKSKTVEAWKQVTIDYVTWTASGAFYVGDKDVSYPFNISNAIITATVESSADVCMVTKAKRTDNTKTTLSMMRVSNTGSVTVNVRVCGTY